MCYETSFILSVELSKVIGGKKKSELVILFYLFQERYLYIYINMLNHVHVLHTTVRGKHFFKCVVLNFCNGIVQQNEKNHNLICFIRSSVVLHISSFNDQIISLYILTPLSHSNTCSTSSTMIFFCVLYKNIPQGLAFH